MKRGVETLLKRVLQALSPFMHTIPCTNEKQNPRLLQQGIVQSSCSRSSLTYTLVFQVRRALIQVVEALRACWSEI
jgi:hypothetical protein